VVGVSAETLLRNAGVARWRAQYAAVMDLKDATLMFLSESAGCPAVASLARFAYDQLWAGREVDYRLFDDMLGEASERGVLEAMRNKYNPTAYDAILTPITEEIGRQKPVRLSRDFWRGAPAPRWPSDPLVASDWPSPA
jgi:hypothetical protein